MNGFAEDPRVSYSAHMGKAEFFAWLQTKEGGRYELKNGEIVVHAGVSRKHHRVVNGFARSLMSQLPAASWDVAIGEFAVEIEGDIRYPDVLVERRADDADAYSTTQAVVLIEVLSPSSSGRDFHEKLAEYIRLPALETYIVASQDEAVVWVWQRDPATRAFPAQPDEIAGPDCVISVAALGVTLPLAEVYSGLTGA